MHNIVFVHILFYRFVITFRYSTEHLQDCFQTTSRCTCTRTNILSLIVYSYKAKNLMVTLRYWPHSYSKELVKMPTIQ